MSKPITVVFQDSQGNQTSVLAPVGTSVMQVAIRNRIKGILADCGGGLSCSTCHVYVDSAYNFAPITSLEQDMLDFAFEVKPTSRLSCQLILSESMDGIIIQLPSKQS